MIGTEKRRVKDWASLKKGRKGERSAVGISVDLQPTALKEHKKILPLTISSCIGFASHRKEGGGGEKKKEGRGGRVDVPAHSIRGKRGRREKQLVEN